MNWTVRQLARLAGITPRTLHYYDEIGLLPPSAVGENGYRYYDEAAALRLQQVLFYRELDLSLGDIRAILDDPSFETRQALLTHRQALRDRAERIETLITTIDKTIAHLEGERAMDAEELFGGFETEQERQWSQEAIEQYGHDNPLVQVSARRWRSYTAADRARIKTEGGAIYSAMVSLIDTDPTSAPVQAVVARWHDHLRYFYEPDADLLAGLGQMYADNPDFAATFAAMHPRLPEFLRAAIAHYAANLT